MVCDGQRRGRNPGREPAAGDVFDEGDSGDEIGDRWGRSPSDL